MSKFNNRKKPQFKPNFLYSIISVALVLFLLGFFGLVLIQMQKIVTIFKEKIIVMVEFKEDVGQSDIVRFQENLGNSSFAKQNSVAFIGKAEAAKMMEGEFGEEYLNLGLQNPYYDVITFNVKASFMVEDSLKKIKTNIRKSNFVNDVFYQEDLTSQIAGNLPRIGYFSLGLGIVFILVAITLIHNTIRLSLYSNRFLIKNMQLVGAKWEFISKPYIMKSIRHGVISGLIAIGALITFWFWALKKIPELKVIQNIPGLIFLSLILLLLGITINALSTYRVVNRYLKMDEDDLY